MENPAAPRKRPNLPLRLEQQKFSIRAPRPTALIRWIVPARQHPLRTRPVCRNLPQLMLPNPRPKPLRRVEPEVRSIRRPAQVADQPTHRQNLVGLRPVRLTHKQVPAIRVSQPLPIR